MTKVYIDQYEAWPVYYIHPADQEEEAATYAERCDVPQELLDRYRRVEAEYADIQHRLESIYTQEDPTP